ncbi:MAG: hypothetical protein R3C24_00480 [Cyanobacteriota/Melainabacteria group bacterium]
MLKSRKSDNPYGRQLRGMMPAVSHYVRFIGGRTGGIQPLPAAHFWLVSSAPELWLNWL